MFESLKKKITKKENFFFLLFFISAFLLSFLIFLLLTGRITEISNYNLISNLLFTDLLIILLLIFLTTLKVFKIFKRKNNEKKIGDKDSSNLHTRITLLITVITLIPSLSVTIISIIFFDQGIKAWFNEKVNVAISGSKLISESYFKEHSNNLKNDLIFLNNEITNQKIAFFTNKDRLTELLRSLLIFKSIDEAIIFEKGGQLLAKVGSSFLIEKEPPPPLWSLYRADDGEMAIFTNDNQNKVRGLIKLNRVIPTYLYIGKEVDSFVLSRVESVNSAASKYLNLEKNIDELQNLSYQLFFAINLLVILSSIWLGLLFANRLTIPINRIISVSEKISSGNFKTRIREFSNISDFNILSESLNKMVSILLEQKSKLFSAKKIIDQRRKFTENILEGLSDGVIYIDKSKRITMCNLAAVNLLGKELKNKKISEVLPHLLDLIEGADNKNINEREKQIKVVHNDSQKIINVKISEENKFKNSFGKIITLNDVTELVSAQKQAAWSNVAQYLAHEIKNPLTPINLSAQRIQNNFKEKKLSMKIIDNCTQTIIRQVSDIKKLVSEFSEFARMPKSNFELLNVSDLIKQQVDNQKIINKNIKFMFIEHTKNIMIECDESKINRLFNNLIKNAVESVCEKKNQKIQISVKKNTNKVIINFEDSGKGFPVEKEILFEPYITNKKGGTGLGLAICKKIIEEHNGDIKLFNSELFGGAGVRISMPI